MGGMPSSMLPHSMMPHGSMAHGPIPHGPMPPAPGGYQTSSSYGAAAGSQKQNDIKSPSPTRPDAASMATESIGSPTSGNRTNFTGSIGSPEASFPGPEHTGLDEEQDIKPDRIESQDRDRKEDAEEERELTPTFRRAPVPRQSKARLEEVKQEPLTRSRRGKC